jgi:hypothetical protein
MPLEDTETIAGLIETNPKSTDLISFGDDHIRLIKKVLKNTFAESVVMVQRVEDVQLAEQSARSPGIVHTMEFTPKFETSGLHVEWNCGANVWSGAKAITLSFQIWDSTTESVEGDGGTEGEIGVPITHEIRTIGFNKAADTVGGQGLADVVYGYCGVSGDYTDHPGGTFNIEVRVATSDTYVNGLYENGGWSVADKHLIITEYN